MKFEQRKVWPSRKVHMFQAGSDVSFCGLCWREAGDKFGTIDYPDQEWRQPYDDLNYCMSCRRKADSYTGRKYKPLTEKYEHLRKAYERKAGK